MARFKSTMDTINADLKRRIRALKRELPEIILEGVKDTVEPMKAATPRGRWGKLSRTWRAKRIRGGASLYNSAPYAGIIEVGSRPHPVSAVGRRRIKSWARAQLKVGPKEAGRIAAAVSSKIRKEGSRPRYFVRNRLDKIRDQAGPGISRAINTFANSKK